MAILKPSILRLPDQEQHLLSEYDHHHLKHTYTNISQTYVKYMKR